MNFLVVSMSMKFSNKYYFISSFFLQDSRPLCAPPRQATPPSATSSHLYQVGLEQYYKLLDSRRSMVCACVYIYLYMCVSDQHGGFELQAAEDMDRQNRLLEQLQRLRAPQTQNQTEEPSQASFAPLLDIPVDSYSHPDSLKHPRSSPTIPNWLLTQNPHSPPSEDDELETTSRRGRTPFRNGHSQSEANKKEKAGRDVFFTVLDTPRHRRPLLAQVFGPLRRSQSSEAPSVGHSGEKQAQEPQEYELKTVCISKTKRSLGEEICAVCFSSV